MALPPSPLAGLTPGAARERTESRRVRHRKYELLAHIDYAKRIYLMALLDEFKGDLGLVDPFWDHHELAAKSACADQEGRYDQLASLGDQWRRRGVPQQDEETIWLCQGDHQFAARRPRAAGLQAIGYVLPDHLNQFKSEGDLNLSAHRQAWAAANLDDQTSHWLEEDAKYFLHQSLSTPCLNVLQSCAGAELTDLQGRTLLDFHGNNVHQAGFGHPRVIEAIVRQMRELSFCPRRYTNLPAIQLARKLTELAPGDLNKVLFAPGGTSAVGMALKLARAATGRHKTISMWDSFHGASLDAISIGGEAIFRRGIGPLLPGCEHVPPPDNRHCPFQCGAACNLRCTDYVEYVLEKEGDVAAVIAETVRSTPFIPPKDYWKRIRAACDRHGALLILDEIPHCLGRTGKMFTCEHYEVIPDMLVIGKGLGGGIFPLAALLARESLDQAMPDKALGHYTHEKNPTACAAGLAMIDVIESEGLIEHARSLGEYTVSQLKALASQHRLIGDVRGLGLLMGVELVRNRSTLERATDEAEQVMYRALSKGLNFKLTMGNILTLTPALTISKAQMDRALAILDESLTEVERGQSDDRTGA